jgi:hypothetical protein
VGGFGSGALVEETASKWAYPPQDVNWGEGPALNALVSSVGWGDSPYTCCRERYLGRRRKNLVALVWALLGETAVDGVDSGALVGETAEEFGAP